MTQSPTRFNRHRRPWCVLLAACALVAALAASLPPLAAAQPADPPVPVLIVPGLLGSFSSCLFDAACPDEYTFESRTPFGTISLSLGKEWVLDPVEITITSPFPFTRRPAYESLVQIFLDNGYVIGETLFLVPYDWRLPNQSTAGTIAAAIDNARAVSGSAEVDVVAHSMGGLAVRHLVEAQGRPDIRRIALLGTPHRGAAKAYNPWEGGDFSRYGSLERHYLIEPMIEDMKAAAGMAGADDYRFVQEQIPSVRQLLPVADYLRNTATGRMIRVGKMYWRNDLLPELSPAALAANVGLGQVRDFAGTGTPTLKLIGVRRTSGAADRRWRDGRPVKYTTGSRGDDTVLTSSACLAGVDCVLLPGAAHTLLPDAARAQVYAFIADAPPAPGSLARGRESPGESAPAAEPPASRLSFRTRDDVLLTLTSPDGRRIGLAAGRGERWLEIPGHHYAGSPARTNALGVDDPGAGDWLLTVATAGEGRVPFAIHAAHRAAGERATARIDGSVEPGGARIYLVRVPGSVTGLEIVPGPAAP